MRGRGDEKGKQASEKVKSEKRKLKSELRGTYITRKRTPYNYKLLIAKF
jgi:hypothetical protein